MVSIDSLLNEVALCRRRVADYGDMGGVIYNATTFSATHPVRISPGVPREVRDGNAEYVEATTVIYTHTGTDFARDDEIVHGSNVYEVIGVRSPSVSNHHVALVCKVQTDGI